MNIIKNQDRLVHMLQIPSVGMNETNTNWPENFLIVLLTFLRLMFVTKTDANDVQADL